MNYLSRLRHQFNGIPVGINRMPIFIQNQSYTCLLRCNMKIQLFLAAVATLALVFSTVTAHPLDLEERYYGQWVTHPKPTLGPPEVTFTRHTPPTRPTVTRITPGGSSYEYYE